MYPRVIQLSDVLQDAVVWAAVAANDVVEAVIERKAFLLDDQRTPTQNGSALQNRHMLSGLCEQCSGGQSSEAAANHNHVVRLLAHRA